MNRTVRAVLQAEVGQFESSMGRAAQAVTGVATAAERAASRVTAAKDQQAQAALKVEQAEKNLQKVTADGSATDAQRRAAATGLDSARSDLADTTRGLAVAETESARAARSQESAWGRLAATARDNEQAWTTVGTGLTVAGGALTALGAAAVNTGISYNTLQQTTSKALMTMLGDSQAVAAQMEQFDAFAQTSPFARDVFLQAQQQMLGFQIEASKVIPYLDAIQNAVAAVGGNNQHIAEISTIMSQISASSKITAMDLREFGNRGLDAATLIGSQLGMTGQQIRESITAGTLDAQVALDALAAGMQERFGGAAAGLKDTFEGAMDRVRAVWRDIGAMLAEPLVSADGGGFLVDLSNRVADLGREFLALPGPVRVGLAALVGTPAVLATLAGAFLMATPRVVAWWNALGEVAVVGPKAQHAIRGVGRAIPGLLVGAAVIGGLISAVGALAEIATAGSEGAAGIDEFGAALGRMSAVTDLDDMFAFGGDVQDFDSALRILTSNDVNSWMERLGSNLAGIIPGFQNVHNPVREAESAFTAAGEALAQLAASGEGDEAARQFEVLAEAAERQGISQERLLDLMPAYRAELNGASADAAEFANALGSSADAYEEMWARYAAKQADADAAKEALDELYQAARNVAEGFIDFSATFDDDPFSLDRWVADLEAQTQALRDFNGNMATLYERGAPPAVFDVIDAMDPTNAAIYAQHLADASDADFSHVVDSVRDANAAMDEGANSAAEYRDAYREPIELDIRPGEVLDFADTIPDVDPIDVPVTADTASAQNAIQDITGFITGNSVDVPVGANTGPAEGEFHNTVSEWEGTTVDVALDMDNSRARSVFNTTTGEWETHVTITGLNADGSDAIEVFNGITHEWLRTETDTGLGANDTSARQTVEGFRSYARQGVTVPVSADTARARAQIQSLRDSAAIAVGAMTMRSMGGPVVGPGSGTSDSIPAIGPGGARYRLSNGEHVLTAREVQLMGGQQAVYQFRSMLNAGAMQAFASGGAVTAARNQVSRLRQRVVAQRATVRAARKSGNERRIDTEEARLERLREQLSEAQEKHGRLVERTRDVRRGVRRGTYMDRATGSLSGAYGLVDELSDMSRNPDISARQRSSLAAAAGRADRQMQSLFTQAERVENRLAAARDRMSELAQISEGVTRRLSGEFGLGDALTASYDYSTSPAQSGRSMLAQAQAHTEKLKRFALQLQALAKAGFAGTIVEEVALLGSEQGSEVAQALLSMGRADRAELNEAYRRMGVWSGRAGQYVTHGFFDGGVSAAQGLVRGLESQQGAIEKQIERVARGMESALKRALGINSPSLVAMNIGENFGGTLGDSAASSIAGKYAKITQAAAGMASAMQAGIPAYPAGSEMAGLQAMSRAGGLQDLLGTVGVATGGPVAPDYRQQPAPIPTIQVQAPTGGPQFTGPLVQVERLVQTDLDELDSAIEWQFAGMKS